MLRWLVEQRPKRVLLIDDSEPQLRMAALVLSHAGFEVRTSTSVTELTSALGERVIRVAFLVDEAPTANDSAVFAVIRVARVTEEAVNVFEMKDQDLLTASQLIHDLEVLAVSVGNGPYTPAADDSPAVLERSGDAA